RTKDGRWLTIESSAVPVLDADGNVTAILGSAHEVTEREELRLRVSELNALYRVADAVATQPIDGLYGEALDALLSATAATRASLLLYDDGVMRFRAWRNLSDAYRAATEGHSPWEPDDADPKPVLVPDVAEGGFDAELEASIRNEGIASLAFVPIVHAGRLLGKFMLYADSPHAWNDREVRLCLTIANHLGSATVRTQTVSALRTQREQLETIMRTVDEGIVVQSTNGDLVYANEAATRFVGYTSPDELVESDRTQTYARFEVFDENGDPLPLSELPGRRALVTGVSSERTMRYRIIATGEERWSLVRADPVFDDDGNVTMSVSVIHDVTAARAAAERMEFLTRASEFLNETLQVEQTLGTLADLAVPAFAGHVTVDLLQDGGIRCIGARHLDPVKTELMRDLRVKYPPTVEDHPVQRALRTGEPQFVP